MMTGLGLLKFYAYYLKRTSAEETPDAVAGPDLDDFETTLSTEPKQTFDIFQVLARAEWDTLMFFYGVVLCVGGLGTIGYLAGTSDFMYNGLGVTYANILVGILSAIIDNIPIMFAVLTMSPDMSLGQWLLVTLTAGVGGSLLSIGSAAGVALMGQTRGLVYFLWSLTLELGYRTGLCTEYMDTFSGQFTPDVGML